MNEFVRGEPFVAMKIHEIRSPFYASTRLQVCELMLGGNVANLLFTTELKVARIEFGEWLEPLPVVDGEPI
jgi:hypothetical protein